MFLAVLRIITSRPCVTYAGIQLIGAVCSSGYINVGNMYWLINEGNEWYVPHVNYESLILNENFQFYAKSFESSLNVDRPWWHMNIDLDINAFFTLFFYYTQNIAQFLCNKIQTTRIFTWQHTVDTRTIIGNTFFGSHI